MKAEPNLTNLLLFHKNATNPASFVKIYSHLLLLLQPDGRLRLTPRYVIYSHPPGRAPEDLQALCQAGQVKQGWQE